MAWDVWQTVFRDDQANLVLYDRSVFLVGTTVEVPAGDDLRAEANVIYLGSSEYLPSPLVASMPSGELVPVQGFGEFFLQPRMRRYRDVDVKVKVQINSIPEGKDDHWFGITPRVLAPNHWNAYLVYIRQNGDVDFGVMGQVLDVKSKFASEVSYQPVSLRIKAEGDRVETWVNGEPCHDWRDVDKAFIREGDIYLIAFGATVAIHEIEIKVKKWYAPIIRFFSGFWGHPGWRCCCYFWHHSRSGNNPRLVAIVPGLHVIVVKSFQKVSGS